MRKKIMILNGSPRKNGNTSALVKAFTEGAESAGNTVYINGKPEIEKARELGRSIA